MVYIVNWNLQFLNNVLLLKLRFSSASHIKTGDLSIHVSVSIYTLLIKLNKISNFISKLVTSFKNLFCKDYSWLFVKDKDSLFVELISCLLYFISYRPVILYSIFNCNKQRSLVSLMFMTNWYWICFCVLKVMAIYQQVIPS